MVRRVFANISRWRYLLAIPVVLFAWSASLFFLIAVSFGIEHGEMRVTADTRHYSERLDRAGNIALGLFVAAELIAIGTVLMSRPRFLLRWPRLAQALGAFVAFVVLSLLSYLFVLAMLYTGFDPFFGIDRAVSDWILSLTAGLSRIAPAIQLS